MKKLMDLKYFFQDQIKNYNKHVFFDFGEFRQAEFLEFLNLEIETLHLRLERT